MQIVRDEYARTVNRYVLDIDADYLRGVNEHLKKYLVKPKMPIDITAQDIVDVFNGEDTDKLVIKCEMHWGHRDDSTYMTNLGDWLKQYVDEDLWDTECECIDVETDDYETYFWED